MIERRSVFKAALAAGAGVLAAACSSGGSGSGVGSPQAPEPPKARITAEPAVAAKDVPVTQPVTVQVAEGTLTEVTLTNAEGKPIAGQLSPDKLRWTSSEPLGYGKQYKYAAKAVGTDGKPVELTGAFDTVKPASQVRATVYPGDNAEVGVGMPVAVKFAAPVKDRAAAQKALSIETTPQVEGSWGWLHDQQVDWRPKEYWPAGTKVKVAAKLYGVHYGGGAYGQDDITSEFTIGRNQVVKIHTPDHVMRVYRDGAQTASYPCSNGKDAVPDLNTPNGKFIIMEKKPEAIFDNARYGYTNVRKTWALRFSNHGEFIHENDENAANIGKNNTSHGCVNLLGKDAKAYYDSAILGDPVEVTGASVNMPTSSDVMDWLLDWPTWKSKSAI